MTGVAVDMLFSVLEDDPDRAWPRIGPLGTGCRPPALPLEHGCSLVLAGELTRLPVAVHSAAAPMLMLRGWPLRDRTGVSAGPR